MVDVAVAKQEVDAGKVPRSPAFLVIDAIAVAVQISRAAMGALGSAQEERLIEVPVVALNRGIVGLLSDENRIRQPAQAIVLRMANGTILEEKQIAGVIGLAPGPIAGDVLRIGVL